MMKKHYKKYKNSLAVLIFLCGVLALSSCEKIIELDTDGIEAKYVIEANLSDETGDCEVTISRTIDIQQPNVYPPVEDAEVTISEVGGNTVALHELTPGRYTSFDITAEAGKTYHLRIVVDGHEFTATCKVPEKVNLDSVYIDDFTGFGDVRKFSYVIFQDPPETENWYRFIQYKSGIQNSNIFILSDEFSNGRTINTFLAYFDQSDVQRIDAGDTIKIEMQTIAKPVYDFFRSLSQSSTGGTEVIAPGNPISNIEGGAIGYFNTYISQRKTVIVKP